MCVVCVWVYSASGYIMHHYNGIWGRPTCAPSGRNMHHQAAMCTMVHKVDYIFWKIQGSLICLSVCLSVCLGLLRLHYTGPWPWIFLGQSMIFYWECMYVNLKVGSLSMSSCFFFHYIRSLFKVTDLTIMKYSFWYLMNMYYNPVNCFKLLGLLKYKSLSQHFLS